MDRGRRYEADEPEDRYVRDRDRGKAPREEREDPGRGGGGAGAEREGDGPREYVREDAVRSRERSPSPNTRREEEDARNSGNNLYVSGLSSRTTERDLEDHFNREGRVADCRLVVDPRSKESRGFAFIMMEGPEDAARCVKYLDRSVLQGRVITVQLARRSRPRTPTPGRFLGVRPVRDTLPSRGGEPFVERRGGPGGYGGGGYGGGGGGGYDREPYPVRRSSPDYGPYRRDRSPDYRGRGGDYRDFR